MIMKINKLAHQKTTYDFIRYGVIAASSISSPTIFAADISARLEEIIVTARKREESIQDVPVAISVLSNEALERFDMSSLEKIASMTPQFTIARASNGNSASLSFRGIGSSFTSLGIEQSVAVILDGAYYGQGRVINEGFFDVNRVELLKGPQALFFGKNGSAGVVSIVTADPTDEFEAMTRVAYEFEAQQPVYEAMISGSLTDNFSARLAVRGSTMSRGYVKNVASDQVFGYVDVATGATGTTRSSATDGWGPDEEALSGRLTLKYENDRVTNTTKISSSRTEVGNASWNYIVYDCPSLALSPCGRNFRNAMNNLPADFANNELPFSQRNGELKNTYDSLQFTNSTQFDIGEWSLNAVLNYQDLENVYTIDADYYSSPTSSTFANEKDEYSAYSAEFRGQSNFDGPWNFMLGGLYQESELKSQQATILAGITNSLAPLPENVYETFDKFSDTDGETLAIFGQITFDISDQLELAVGGRYTRETKESNFIHKYVNPALADLFVAGQPINADQKWTNFSPEVTLTWQPADELTIYGAYKTGYKSGGFSNSAILSVFTQPSDFVFGPEKPKGFETGVRSVLFDDTLRLGLTAYYYKYDDLQIEVFNSSLVSFNAGNAGATITKGIEAEFEWAPTIGLSVFGSLNFNSSTYRDFDNAPCYAGQTIAQGCTIDSSVLGGTRQNLTGERTAVAPKVTGNLGFNWEVDAGPGTVSLSGNARYSDKYNISQYANPRTIQDSYVMLDAAIKYSLYESGWEIALIGRNLTDEFVLTGTLDVVGGGTGTGTAAGVPANQAGLVSMPRTALLQLTKRF